MKTTKNILIFLAVNTIIYLLITFVQLDFDFRNWFPLSRFVVVVWFVASLYSIVLNKE